jgi:hypothetical protein
MSGRLAIAGVDLMSKKHLTLRHDTGRIFLSRIAPLHGVRDVL